LANFFKLKKKQRERERERKRKMSEKLNEKPIEKTRFIEGLDVVKNILITTDLEPDDVIALKDLSSVIKDSHVITFLVGEGCARIKAERMEVYMNTFFNHVKNKKVLQGYSSKKDFPLDGEDLFTKEQLKTFREENEKLPNTNVLLELMNLDIDLVFNLKPPREFFALFTNPSETFHSTVLKKFANIHFITYASFNLRCLMDRNNPKVKDRILEFLESFPSVIYYESYLATGEMSELNRYEFPFEKLPVFTKKLIKDWNDHMLEDCRLTILNENKKEKEKQDKAKINRNQKPIDSIVRNEGWQIVNADCGLIASLFLNLTKNVDFYKGSIQFDKDGYSVPTKNENGKFFIVNPPDDQSKLDLKKRQLKFYQDFYK